MEELPPRRIGEKGRPGPGRPPNVLTRPQMLKDFRRVYKSDGKAGPKAICQLYKDDVAKFVDKLNGMEKEYREEIRKRRAVKEAEEVGSLDEAEGRALGLIERLLAGYQG